ncbi:hypothetical protein LTR29_013093 [Friedmanniomyces endolithicus]|nr:hypothetical protein LTR29_013093 [Friedmanniomyces endolithicus]
MHTFTLTYLLLAASAHAYYYTATDGSGDAFYAAPVLFEQAALTPNNTNTIPFTIDSFEGWSWRVNITNVAVPNATVASPGDSASLTLDPHVAYTTYDLRWPNSGTLNDQLISMANTSGVSSSGLDMCAYVTTGIVAKQAQSNCSSALGDQCVQSMLNDLANSPNAATCGWAPMATLQGCENVFVNATNGLNTLGFTLGNSTASSNSTAQALQPNEAFFYSTSEAIAATNLTYLDAQKQALQLMILQVGGQSQVLCMSLNDATSNTTSTASPSSSTSAAPSSTSHSAAVAGVERMVGFGVVGLAGLAAGFSLLANTFASPICQRRAYADGTARNEAHPFKGYHIDPLDAPLRPARPLSHPPAVADPTPSERTKAEEAKLARFRTVFGSGRPDPSDRKRSIEGKSQLVAGVLVPPRPEEPENCCLSGCVNCVWDLFRDETEEWAARSGEARAKMKRIEGRGEGRDMGLVGAGEGAARHVGGSMDDGGGGSETGWAGGELGGGGQEGDVDLFADIPVGIREFMKTEKKLKQKQKQSRKAPD